MVGILETQSQQWIIESTALRNNINYGGEDEEEEEYLVTVSAGGGGEAEAIVNYELDFFPGVTIIVFGEIFWDGGTELVEMWSGEGRREERDCVRMWKLEFTYGMESKQRNGQGGGSKSLSTKREQP
ncbi:hypothetical protein RUND412_010513 [Rhizina undulata]